MFLKKITRRGIGRAVAVAALTAVAPHAARAAGAAGPGDGVPAAAAPAASAAPARRPVEHFARLPRTSRVSLSPDGQQVAMLISEGGRTAVATLGLAEGAPLRVVMQTDNEKFSFNWARWVGNQRLLVSVRYAARRSFVGTVETRLFAVQADGSGQRALQRDGATPGLGQRGASQQFQDRVIDWLPGDGRHVLVQMGEPGSALPAVFKLNVDDGSRTVVQGPEKHVVRWVTDRRHAVRVGVRAAPDGSSAVLLRDGASGPWRTLWAANDEADAVLPLGFGSDPQELFVQAAHNGRLAVFAVRLDDPALPRRLLLADDEGDVGGGLLVVPGSGEVLGLRGGLTDDDGEQRAELWSPPWRTLAVQLDGALPGSSVRFIDIADDGQRYLAYASGNGKPVRYYVGDRQTGTLKLIDEAYPELAGAALAGKRELTIKARDGLSLRAYLTVPRGAGGSPLPMVVLPHGGPASRDDDDFDAWTEFLADRGYAVLQVNFRGSDGYGIAFRQAGVQRWGLEMQDDLSDAAQWAVAQGVADAGRICIVGASYGGYAALMGAVKTPELYRCAASFAGVTDLRALIAHESEYHGGRRRAERMFGDSWSDSDRLRATSPVQQVQRIQVPVLLVHGTADRSVPVEQGQAMARALRSAGKRHQYIEQDGGDHHLSRQPDRLQFFQALEAFLDQHIGGRR